MVFKGFLQTYFVGFTWLGLILLLITEINSIYNSEQLLVNNLIKTINKQASSIALETQKALPGQSELPLFAMKR